ncbi:MAG: TMEM165/GDT1 family protein, partial [Clostridium sp.]
ILGVFAISGVSVLAGDLIGDLIPMRLIKLAASAMFLFFGLMNLRCNDSEEEGHHFALKIPVISIAFTFVVAELGDKTQLATVALAADHMGEHLPVFLGASFGLILANILGIFAGKLIFSHLREDTVKVGSSFIFFLFGSLTLFEAVPGSTMIFIVYSTVLILCAYAIYTISRRHTNMQ